MTNIQPLEVGYILRKAREQSVKAVDDFRQKWTQGTKTLDLMQPTTLEQISYGKNKTDTLFYMPKEICFWR